MELLVPLQTFEVGKVRIGVPTLGPKRMVPLAYVDGELRFPSLSMLLPLSTVKSYDAATGRLSLSLAEHPILATRLRLFQDILFQAVVAQQKTWFPRERAKTTEEIRAGFQPILDGDTLFLYCPAAAVSGIQDIQVFSKGVWTHGVKASHFQPGKEARLAIRIQGLSFHLSPATGAWTGKFRLQHRVLSVLTSA